MPPKSDPTHRPRYRFRTSVISASLALLALAPAASSATVRANGGMQIHAACAGDTLSGSVRGKAGAVEVKLFAKRGPSAAFAATGLTSSIRASGGNGSPFSFNVGRLTAAAYRVEAGDARSNEVPVASCAPGHQVPEAPLTLLLPLSVLALVTLTFGRRRFLGSRL